MMTRTHSLTFLSLVPLLICSCGESEHESVTVATEQETTAASTEETSEAATPDASKEVSDATTEQIPEEKPSTETVTPPAEEVAEELPQLSLPEPEEEAPRFQADDVEGSSNAILEHLNDEQKEELENAMVLLMRHAHEDEAEIYNTINGKTAKEIINMAHSLTNEPVRFDANEPDASGAAMLAQLNSREREAFTDAMTALMIHYKEDSTTVYNTIHNKTAQEVIDMVDSMQKQLPRFDANDPDASAKLLLKHISEAEQEKLTAAMISLQNQYEEKELYAMINGLTAAEIIQLVPAASEQPQDATVAPPTPQESTEPAEPTSSPELPL
jgi:allophanate hydrolase subunit 1